MVFKRVGFYLLSIVMLYSLAGCQKAATNQTANVVTINQHKEDALIKKERTLEASSHDSSANINKRILDYLYSQHINGSVAIMKNGQFIFNEGVGYANFANQTLNNASTTFLIGSITKTFLATGIMQLQEQGKLSIYDPVSKYIPGFPNGNRIEIYHLLTHTSGIEPPIWHRGDTTPLSLVREIEKRPLQFPAGAKWNYLDANYMVVGYILEKVSGMPLHDYIQKNIFDKANMEQSGFITQGQLNGYNSIGYILGAKSNQLVPIRIQNAYVLYGCGDIYMTAHDLSLYDEALLDGKLVNNSSLASILRPGVHSTYGLGLYNGPTFSYSHGVLAGYVGLHMFYKDHTVISILLNYKDKQMNILRVGEGLHDLVSEKNDTPVLS